MKIYKVGGEWVCDSQGGTACLPVCLEDGRLKMGADGNTICEEEQVANITDIPSSTPTSALTLSLVTLSTVTASSLAGLQASDVSPSSSAGGSKDSQIAGGVVGGVIGLALIGGLIFFLRRRKRNHEKPSAHHESAAIADKCHTSPIYGGAGAAVVPPPAAPTRQFTDPEFANPPPSQQPVVPIAPVHTPQQ